MTCAEILAFCLQSPRRFAFCGEIANDAGLARMACAEIC
jgi:hypothetical protein